MGSTARWAAFAAAVLLPACGGGGGGGSLPPSPQPNFTLQDVNPNSATFNMNVSMNGYIGLVPGIYFGHAT